MNTLLPRVRQLLTFLLDLLQRGRELLTPRPELTQGNDLSLIGIEQALVLPFEPLLLLQQLLLLRFQPGEVLLLGCRPGLMHVRDHAWRLQQLDQRLPDDLHPTRTSVIGS